MATPPAPVRPPAPQLVTRAALEAELVTLRRDLKASRAANLELIVEARDARTARDAAERRARELETRLGVGNWGKGALFARDR